MELPIPYSQNIDNNTQIKMLTDGERIKDEGVKGETEGSS